MSSKGGSEPPSEERKETEKRKINRRGDLLVSDDDTGCSGKMT